MKSNLVRAGLLFTLVLRLSAEGADEYRVAAPGYRYSFPADHFNHPGFQTEWWYYTGNLRDPGGRRFGFELTFFRQGVSRSASPSDVWEVRDVWLAHLALSDIDRGRFLHTERLNRAGAGIAGADARQARVWNGNWQAQWTLDAQAPGGMAAQQLQAVAEHFSFDLTLRTSKPPVIHGEHGISQKAQGSGHASHYVSYTRLQTSGTIRIDGQPFQVEGDSWMDHEFFTHQLAANQTGWDWFSLQFDDGSEVMLFQLRHKDGSLDAFSAGTYIDAQGHATHLSAGGLFARSEYPVDQSALRRPLSGRMEHPYPVIGPGGRAQHQASAAGTDRQIQRLTNLLGGSDRCDRHAQRKAASGSRLSRNDRLRGPRADG